MIAALIRCFCPAVCWLCAACMLPGLLAVSLWFLGDTSCVDLQEALFSDLVLDCCVPGKGGIQLPLVLHRLV